MSYLYVAHQGSGQDGQLYFTFTRDGSSWEPDRQVPNAGMTESPSALFFNDRLYVFHQGFGDDGQLWYSSFDGQTWAGDQQVPNVGMTAGPARASASTTGSTSSIRASRTTASCGIAPSTARPGPGIGK